jgi:hypothetical protein
VKRRLLGGFLTTYESSIEDLAEVAGPSGAVYNLLTEVFWDGDEGGDIRVMVELQEDAPPHGELMDDFIIAPDGTFVDE